jgi:acetyl-CoA carboxylase biotin carboxyl carrier protein
MNEPVVDARTGAPDRSGDTDGDHDLARVRGDIVALLAGLDRPPSTLRVRAGEVSVDITWHERLPPTGEGTRSAGHAAPAPDTDHLTSPGVGVFYHASEPGAEPFVSVGSMVRRGQQVGIIEAMKLMIPIEADRDGRITEVLKPDGEPVEYGEALFALRVAEA